MSVVSGGDETRALQGGGRLALTLAGLYFLVGAAFTGFTGKWFAGFPPQLDVAQLIFGNNSVGTYVEGALAGLLGIGCLSAAIISARRQRASVE
jgi:hypothetical protein